MMKIDIKKSPIFYMGNKYRLLKQILPLFPNDIDTFYDLFGGSSVVSMNVVSNKTIYNEINDITIGLLNIFKEFEIDNKLLIKYEKGGNKNEIN